MEMTKKELVAACERDSLYRTPGLNDKLYLHYKGYRRIENLEEYSGLRVIWLEGNGLCEIENLDHQGELRTLYLQENCIEKIQNLNHLKNLDTLNLSQNFIQKIEHLEGCINLKSLLLGQNKLKELKQLAEIAKLKSLTCIDLQKNFIEDPAIVDLLAECKNLVLVYLKGNPCVKKIKFYRRNLIYRIKKLNYLDDRPVFPEERRRSVAFMEALNADGIKAAQKSEQEELQKIKREKREREQANRDAFNAMIAKGLTLKEQRQKELDAGVVVFPEKQGEDKENAPNNPQDPQVLSLAEVSHQTCCAKQPANENKKPVSSYSREEIHPVQEHKDLKQHRREEIEELLAKAKVTYGQNQENSHLQEEDSLPTPALSKPVSSSRNSNEENIRAPSDKENDSSQHNQERVVNT